MSNRFKDEPLRAENQGDPPPTPTAAERARKQLRLKKESPPLKDYVIEYMVVIAIVALFFWIAFDFVPPWLSG